MKRNQFHHVIRAAGAVLGVDEVLVVGSQAVHGSLAKVALLGDFSMEVDVAAAGDSEGRMADLIDGAIGEGSLFHETHGYYGHGVVEATARLPEGWRTRLVAHSAPDTNGVTALCLDPHDLWLSKAYAGRDKDLPFCRAMFDEGLVDPAVLRERLSLMGSLPDANRARMEGMIEAMAAERSLPTRRTLKDKTQPTP